MPTRCWPCAAPKTMAPSTESVHAIGKASRTGQCEHTVKNGECSQSYTAQRLVFWLLSHLVTDSDFVAIFLTENFPLITPGTPVWSQPLVGSTRQHASRWMVDAQRRDE